MKNKHKAIISILIAIIIICIGISIGSSNINFLDTLSILANKILNIPLRDGLELKNIGIDEKYSFKIIKDEKFFRSSRITQKSLHIQKNRNKMLPLKSKCKPI